MAATGQYMVLHGLLWISTLGFLTGFDWLAGKKLGKRSQGYLNLRLPKFISLVIASLTAMASLYLLNKGLISLGAASYLSVPYFAANSYFFAVFFHEMKMARAGASPGG